MTADPTETLSGGNLRDTYGRREVTYRAVNDPLITSDIQAAGGVFDVDGREHVCIDNLPTGGGGGLTVDGTPTDRQILQYNASTGTWQPITEYATTLLGTYQATLTPTNVAAAGTYVFCVDGVSVLTSGGTVTTAVPAICSMNVLSGFDLIDHSKQNLHFGFSSHWVVNDAVSSAYAISPGIYTRSWSDPGTHGLAFTVNSRKGGISDSIGGVGVTEGSNSSAFAAITAISLDSFAPAFTTTAAIPANGKAIYTFSVWARCLLNPSA